MHRGWNGRSVHLEQVRKQVILTKVRPVNS